MQIDMHFYATYAMARAAGIPSGDAFTIAYSAQFVDDSNQQDSDFHSDGGMMWGVATAHHPVDCAKNAAINQSEQRRVWVPFHFLPGGEGNSFEEKLICVKDSEIAKELFAHHIEAALVKDFGLHLLGIGCHVYMDTFSHYGFSGVSSDYNKIDRDSIELETKLGKEIERYIKRKSKDFPKKWRNHAYSFAEDRRFYKKWRNCILSFFGETFSQGLGHGAVYTYPDRPYLHWKCKYKEDRLGTGRLSDRNNPETFLEGCEKLHDYLSTFAAKQYANSSGGQIKFAEIADNVKKILNYQGKKDERIRQWLEFIKNRFGEDNIKYSHEDWENQRQKLGGGKDSASGIGTDVYRFHQAATHHRYYVLKDLLPSHGIMAY